MRPLDQSQFPGLRFVSQNEHSDDGPIWSAYYQGQFFIAPSEQTLFRALVEAEPILALAA